MANFPGAAPSIPTASAGATLAAAGHTALHNLMAGEILALANKMGTGASTPTSGLALLGTGAGTSAWGQVSLTAGVSGILPVANGGTGQSTQTGTGLPVAQTSPTITSPTLTGGGSWAGSPTIVTPTIASFLNALHDHTNAAGGGQLGFAALLSTIFSGQVQSQANTGTAGGTIYYINLGGIKLAWCNTASFATTTSSTNVTVNWPAGFFSAMQAVVGAVNGVGSIATQFFTGNNGTSGAGTTSTYTFYVFTTSGSGTANANLLAIGT